MVTVLLILLTACLPSSCVHAAQSFLHPLIPILSNSLIQELTSTLNPSSLSLVNSGTPSLHLYFRIPRTCLLLRGRYRGICFPNSG
ncbi:hypothetical protein E2C01_098198 [Portunus trituberculatus]|uniref:Secreted protein n=1 Tax=Portunus trituberculatus TaxID=210409 RepID=A0A5B7K7M2_PORTR|nr:hypothetical protein [Portunus trituberculatus]